MCTHAHHASKRHVAFTADMVTKLSVGTLQECSAASLLHTYVGMSAYSLLYAVLTVRTWLRGPLTGDLCSPNFCLFELDLQEDNHLEHNLQLEISFSFFFRPKIVGRELASFSLAYSLFYGQVAFRLCVSNIFQVAGHLRHTSQYEIYERI